MIVNGEYKDDPQKKTPLGKLIHDFNCRKADDMNYSILADRVRYFKEDEEGVATMCKIIEDIVNEEKKATAIKLLEKGLSVEDIASVLRITVDKVEEFINGEVILA